MMFVMLLRPCSVYEILNATTPYGLPLLWLTKKEAYRLSRTLQKFKIVAWAFFF